MTAAKDWPEVTEYLRARDGSNTIHTRSIPLQELSQLPFDIYFHVQKKGDLVVLPPRRSVSPRSLCSSADSFPSYFQTIHRGITASLYWERMTLQGLESFIYHDRIFKQRYDLIVGLSFYELTLFSTCVEVRYNPHQLLCNTVLELREELVNLKRSHPNDQELLSAKSGVLEQGFKLLDEVINSTDCSQDDLLPVVELTSPPPPCSFCGGELFRTIFRCTDSCARNDATTGEEDSKILICDLCFIDGRSCRCGSMEPYRLQPLAELINLRTSIVDVLGLTDGNGLAWS